MEQQYQTPQPPHEKSGGSDQQIDSGKSPENRSPDSDEERQRIKAETQENHEMRSQGTGDEQSSTEYRLDLQLLGELLEEKEFLEAPNHDEKGTAQPDVSMGTKPSDQQTAGQQDEDSSNSGDSEAHSQHSEPEEDQIVDNESGDDAGSNSSDEQMSVQYYQRFKTPDQLQDFFSVMPPPDRKYPPVKARYQKYAERVGQRGFPLKPQQSTVAPKPYLTKRQRTSSQESLFQY